MEIGKRIQKKNNAHEALLRQKDEFCKSWGRIEAVFTEKREQTVDLKNRDAFVTIIQEKMNEENDYIKVIQGLDKNTAASGTAWLQNIVDHIANAVFEMLPSCIS